MKLINMFENLFESIGFKVGYRAQLGVDVNEKFPYVKSNCVLFEKGDTSFWVEIALDESLLVIRPISNVEPIVIRLKDKN